MIIINILKKILFFKFHFIFIRMLEQQLRYGGATFWSLVATFAMVAILSVIIGYFMRKEYVKKKKNKEKIVKTLISIL